MLGFYILELQRGIAFLLELHASVKRRGLGKCLLHHALTLACLQGFASVDFVVHEDNTDAQQFYLAQFCCSCDKNQRWSYDCTSWSHQSATATALALASAACKKPQDESGPRWIRWTLNIQLDTEHTAESRPGLGCIASSARPCSLLLCSRQRPAAASVYFDTAAGSASACTLRRAT